MHLVREESQPAYEIMNEAVPSYRIDMYFVEKVQEST